jgi:hypothetical protein
MTRLREFPAVMQGFFTDRLMRQLHVSGHTVASYRDTFQLLLRYVERRYRNSRPPLLPVGADGPVFPTGRGASLGRDGLEYAIAKYAAAACARCPTLARKRVTSHVLRHTCAMNLPRAGVDLSVIALWLGHQSPATTMVYLHSDVELKRRVMEKTSGPTLRFGKYRAGDRLLAFLKDLSDGRAARGWPDSRRREKVQARETQGAAMLGLACCQIGMSTVRLANGVGHGLRPGERVRLLCGLNALHGQRYRRGARRDGMPITDPGAPDSAIERPTLWFGCSCTPGIHASR